MNIETEEKNNNNKYNNENNKTENSIIDFYHESNSISHFSTTSEGEQGINSNYNNYKFYQSFSEDKNKKNKNNHKNENLHESIKKGIIDISYFYNHNKNNEILLSTYYFCDIKIDDEDKCCLMNKIQQFIDNYKKLIKSN